MQWLFVLSIILLFFLPYRADLSYSMTLYAKRQYRKAQIQHCKVLKI